MRGLAETSRWLVAGLIAGLAALGCQRPGWAQEGLSQPAQVSATEKPEIPVVAGVLVCPLENAVAAYIMFDPTKPLCDFRSSKGTIERFPMKIDAQVVGAPTQRGTVAVWEVKAAPGYDDADLKGDYLENEGGGLSNGHVVLMPANDDLTKVSTLTLPEMAAGDPVPRNMATWISSVSF